MFHREILNGKISSGYVGPHVVLDAVARNVGHNGLCNWLLWTLVQILKEKKKKTFSSSAQISKSLKKCPSIASTALMRSQNRSASLD